jgi:hypothetical protein
MCPALFSSARQRRQRQWVEDGNVSRYAAKKYLSVGNVLAECAERFALRSEDGSANLDLKAAIDLDNHADLSAAAAASVSSRRGARSSA